MECRCIRLAIVHDVTEGALLFASSKLCASRAPWVLMQTPAWSTAIVGDIAPSDGVSKADKRRLEEDAIRRMHAMLGEGSAAGAASR